MHYIPNFCISLLAADSHGSNVSPDLVQSLSKNMFDLILLVQSSSKDISRASSESSDEQEDSQISNAHSYDNDRLDNGRSDKVPQQYNHDRKGVHLGTELDHEELPNNKRMLNWN